MVGGRIFPTPGRGFCPPPEPAGNRGFPARSKRTPRIRPQSLELRKPWVSEPRTRADSRWIITGTPPSTCRRAAGSTCGLQGIVAAVVALALVLGIRLEIPAADTWSPPATTVLPILAGLCHLAVHELTHGPVLRWRTGIRPTCAVEFAFLITGSPAYLNPGTTALVALIPSPL